MAKHPFEAELLASTELARAALLEVTEAHTVGDVVGHEVDESGAVTLFFASRLPGYPNWRWAASLAKPSEDAPVTVLEVELLPGEGALLSPDWVPWSVRLAQYRESQAALEAEQRAAAEAAAELADDEGIDAEDIATDGELISADDDEFEDDEFESDEDEDEDEDDILVNDFSDFDDEIDGVDIDALDDTDDTDDAESDEDSDDEPQDD